MVTKYWKTISITSLLFTTLVFSSCESQDYKKYDEKTSKNASIEEPAGEADRMADGGTSLKKKGKVSVAAEQNASSHADKKMYRKDALGVYDQVEMQPVFPGGEAALSNFVETNLVYPENAIDRNVEGTVRVQFVVDEKGNVKNPVVAGEKTGQGLDEAAMEVIRKMPAWTPGQVNGKNVKTRLVLPITYRLE